MKSKTSYKSCKRLVCLEELENRIVLDAAIDLAPQPETSYDSLDASREAASRGSGTETLPDGTVHYWNDYQSTELNENYDHYWYTNGTQSWTYGGSYWQTNGNGWQYSGDSAEAWNYTGVELGSASHGWEYSGSGNSQVTDSWIYHGYDWSAGQGWEYAGKSDGQWYYETVLTENGGTAHYVGNYTGYEVFDYTFTNGTAPYHNASGTGTGWSEASWTGYWSYNYNYEGGNTNPWNVAPVVTNSHAPTSADHALNATEDTQYVFSTTDFSFSDSDTGDTLHGIKITQLETAGFLKLNGTDVTLNQEIGIGDITDGHLTFDPATNSIGTGYSNFHFKVSDGTHYSESSYAITFNVKGKPGTLDDGFGSHGMVKTDLGGGIDNYEQSVAIQADGKIVVAGTKNNDFSVERYNTDGTLDSSFGDHGIVITDVDVYDSAYCVAIQADGKILVAGYTGDSHDKDFAVVRYNTNGTLDSSFGELGIVTTDVGSAYDSAHSIAIQFDGKIVVAGQGSVPGSSYDAAVIRYNTDGSLDTSFSGDGMVTTNFGGNDCAGSVAIQSDGKIVVAAKTLSGYDFAVARYNTDGSLDTSFSGDGILTTDFYGGSDVAQSIAIQADGKIVVVGEVSDAGRSYFGVARYNDDGTLDTSFSRDGMVTADFSGPAESVVIQSDGKIIVAGETLAIWVFDDGGIGLDSQKAFALVRYNTNGTKDTSFSGDGMVITDVSNGHDYVYSMATQADGNIVVAGNNASYGEIVRFWA
jgi:uncharacterized delta-60 repeat protein